MSAVSTSLPEISPRRRRTDKVMRASLLVATLIALVPLVLIIYFLIKEGLSAWSGSFFSTDPNGNFFGNPGGVRSAIGSWPDRAGGDGARRGPSHPHGSSGTRQRAGVTARRDDRRLPRRLS